MKSLEDVFDVTVFSHANAADREAVSQFDVLIEVPHGATTGQHFSRWAAQIANIPGDLEAFYWVNTDQGAPEYATRLAQMLTDPQWIRANAASALTPGQLETACLRASARRVTVVRALLPRTIVDVNRVWEVDSTTFREAGLTGALGAFVSEEERVVIKAAYDAYQSTVDEAYASHGNAGAMIYNLHTYAPISVSMLPDEPVMDTLRRAYSPEHYSEQERRPVGQLMTARQGEASTANLRLVEHVLASYREIGIELCVNHPFALHPVTTLDTRAYRHRGQVLSLELSREALASHYVPFVELEISDVHVERLSAPLAIAHLAFENT